MRLTQPCKFYWSKLIVRNAVCSERYSVNFHIELHRRLDCRHCSINLHSFLQKKLENAQLHREEKNGSIDRLNVKQQSTLNYSYANEKKTHAVSTPVMRMNVFLYQILDSPLPFCARLRICYEGAFPDQRCCGAFSFSCRRIVPLRRVQERIRMMFCRHPLLCNCLILHCHHRCWHHYSGFL